MVMVVMMMLVMEVEEEEEEHEAALKERKLKDQLVHCMEHDSRQGSC